MEQSFRVGDFVIVPMAKPTEDGRFLSLISLTRNSGDTVLMHKTFDYPRPFGSAAEAILHARTRGTLIAICPQQYW